MTSFVSLRYHPLFPTTSQLDHQTLYLIIKKTKIIENSILRLKNLDKDYDFGISKWNPSPKKKLGTQSHISSHVVGFEIDLAFSIVMLNDYNGDGAIRGKVRNVCQIGNLDLDFLLGEPIWSFPICYEQYGLTFGRIIGHDDDSGCGHLPLLSNDQNARASDEAR